MTQGRRQEIARRIYEAREDAGMTQAELAKRIGTFHSTISRYETGERKPGARYMRGLSEALNKSIPYLRASDWIEKEEDANGTG